MFDTASRGRGVAALLLVVACAWASLTMTAALPEPARAEGGVAFVQAHFGGDPEAMSPAPSNTWYISFQFDKNVGYAPADADATFLEENIAKMHLLDSEGNEVPGARFHTGGTREERQLIYLSTDEWLAPLTEYRVVIDEGIQAANGEDVTVKATEVTFKTADEMPGGLRLIPLVCAIAAAVVLCAGVVAQMVRRARER